ncbi:sensor histidine kinase [Amycolatopsis alkalitolerans]|uniref:Sensor histidine kinase n=1 Tax=Amycolatopsis alkalitolerans TaxID=2547244 RepID=A0A5C4LVL3_9PSEU|nr:histidine kinase [Amycolatopsis alkalitolerans]TNC22976.1 sensor histidine kinase [Amycolatopsis alkalitolerans]
MLQARPDPAVTLAAARRISREIQGGTAAPRARKALRRLRRLTGAHAVGLADLSGITIWSGIVPESGRTEPLVREALHREAPQGKAPLVAVPLQVHGEPGGVLLVAGPVRSDCVREVAALVEYALERGKLEASADQAAQAELRALAAEISPHFVYNALTVIASLVRSEPDRARELMLDFADYTRYSLAKHNEYTVVAEEFRAIETYLALQKAVLAERLQVQVRVAPEVLAVAIPYLVLEPLVENAIRHGIEPSGGTGTVLVRGEASGNDCVISVEDDGVGMDPELARAILAGKGGSGNVGLANVDRRLRTVYGPWFGLVVETAPGAGTKVLVRVPRFAPGVLP